jgi:hypothetical protein
MMALEIRPFADDDLDAAAALLADRHRRHREAEPLLSARYEEPAEAHVEIEALWRSEGASGAVGVREDRPVGYVLGVRKADDAWGRNVWVDYAGHAVDRRRTSATSTEPLQRAGSKRAGRATMPRCPRRTPRS